ncbi:MAG: hypothetical protein ABEI76_07270, partial [Halobacteriales archaeon]
IEYIRLSGIGLFRPNELATTTQWPAQSTVIIMAYSNENTASVTDLLWQLTPDDTLSERGAVAVMLLLTIAQAAGISAFMLL